MKKATQQKIFILFVIVMFSSSSIAFVLTGFSSSSEDKVEVLTNFVVDHELNALTENYYLQRGYTLLKYNYNGTAKEDILVSSLPDVYQTVYNEKQIIVEKINSNETYIRIFNANHDLKIENLTQESIFSSLCETLLSPPSECVLLTNITKTK